MPEARNPARVRREPRTGAPVLCTEHRLDPLRPSIGGVDVAVPGLIARLEPLQFGPAWRILFPDEPRVSRGAGTLLDRTVWVERDPFTEDPYSAWRNAGEYRVRPVRALKECKPE